MLTEEQKEKAVKQFKLQMNGVFEPFNIYGLGSIIPEAIEQTAELALLLHKRMNGNNTPITLDLANGKLRNRYKE